MSLEVSLLVTNRRRKTTIDVLFHLGYYFSKHQPIVHAETKVPTVRIGERKASLPTISMVEVAKHTTKESGREENRLDLVDGEISAVQAIGWRLKMVCMMSVPSWRTIRVENRF